MVDRFNQDRANVVGRGEGELTSPHGFVEMLEARQRSSNSLLCVGLDPVISSIPNSLVSQVWEIGDRLDAEGSIPSGKLTEGIVDSMVLVEFNRKIVDATHEFVSAYKPNIAFYERYGEPGLAALKTTIKHIREVNPTIPVILDAKRADIGATNQGYADMVKGLGADAVTVNPYFGIEGKGALDPFLALGDTGVIVLCRTSNPEAAQMQDVIVKDPKLGEVPYYMMVARMAEEARQKNPNVAIVVGATAPQQLREVRDIFKGQILVPGLGKQGGRPEDLTGVFIDGGGIIANNSSAIIHASKGDDFAEAAAAAALDWRDRINGAKELPMPEGSSQAEKLAANQERTMQILAEAKAVLTDSHFLLKSGKHSEVYINKDAVSLDPEQLAEISRMMAEDLVGRGIEVIAGPAVAGAIIAHEVGRILGRMEGRRIKTVFTDKERGADGQDTQVLKRGFDKEVVGKKVWTVEDILTTGGSAMQTNDAVRANGGEVLGISAIVNRGKVTAEGVGVPELKALASVNVATYEPGPENCPRCAKDEPFNEDFGHGRGQKLTHF
jgi:orotidine-5'-phosphate decarboxylase